MRILQVITTLEAGGAEKLMVDIIPLLQAQGHVVDMLVFRISDTPFARQLQEYGVRIYSFTNTGSVYNPFYLFKLIPFFKRYDLIHAHNTACQYVVALSRFLFRGKSRIVTTEHNTSNRRRSLWWFKPLDRFVYRLYDRIICISEPATESLRQHLCMTNGICTIENGVDIQAFELAAGYKKEKLGCDDDDFIIMQVAGFRIQKDQDTVIRAIALLPDNFQLVLVGDGERRQACEQQAQKLGVASKVHFMGVRMDIPQLLKTADVVVMSSHWEGFGLAAVEGMAAGKPVIASDVEGLKQIVDGAGILFEQGNSKQLAQKIQEIAANTIALNQIADQCQARASKYAISKMVNAYEAVYAHIIHEKV